jgi:hypothetical protein
MLYLVPSALVRRAALVTILWIGLLALMPLAALATGTVTLAWDPSPGTNAISKYNIYYGVASGTYTNTVSAGTNTTLTVSNLLEGTTYYFAATAVDTNGLESDYSAEASTVIIRPPTLNALANVAINENAGQQTINLAGITSGSSNQVQTLVVTASSSNTGLIPNPTVSYTSPSTTGSISFTPAQYAFGSAVITVTVNNGYPTSNTISRTFTVTVNPVNQAPTLNALSNVTINEGAGQQVVNLSGITSGATNENQTLTVTASSSNTGVIPIPTVSYSSASTTGSISFTPVAVAYGSSTITVTVNDGGPSNNVVSRTFVVTVNPVNQPPTLNTLANVTVNENAGLQTVNLSGITSGATNEAQTLVVTASSSNTGVIPTPMVNYTTPNATGTITFTPVAFAYGSSTITVAVNDGGTSNNVVSHTFTVTVNPVNQAPTLNALANLSINESAGLQTVNLAGISSGATNEVQTLTVTASSSNPGLIPSPTVNYTSPNSTGSITFTPVASAYGSATVTVTVNDGGASNNVVSQAFTVTVNPVNQPPTLNALADVAISENAGLQTVNLSGITSGASNEVQTLTVTTTSSNTGLIPKPTVNYTSPNSTGTITFTPVASAYGSATVTITVNDGGTSNNIISRTFTVTVYQVIPPPTISSLTNLFIAMDSSTPVIPFTIGSTTTPAANLTLAGSSDNATLVLPTDIVFGGSNSNRTVTVTPELGQIGDAHITITVNDGTNTANSVFLLSVRQRPAAPGSLRVAGTGP